MPKIVVIAHDIRSLHNVGSLLRTTEGLGVEKVILSGYTPHPDYTGDPRLPHIGKRQRVQINKTGLGAEDTVNWQYQEDIKLVIDELKEKGYKIVGLEQSSNSISLPEFKAPPKMALLLGREVEGLDEDIIAMCHSTVEIPMYGKKESFNVVQAAAMALYHCRFIG